MYTVSVARKHYRRNRETKIEELAKKASVINAIKEIKLVISSPFLGHVWQG